MKSFLIIMFILILSSWAQRQSQVLPFAQIGGLQNNVCLNQCQSLCNEYKYCIAGISKIIVTCIPNFAIFSLDNVSIQDGINMAACGLTDVYSGQNPALNAFFMCSVNCEANQPQNADIQNSTLCIFDTCSYQTLQALVFIQSLVNSKCLDLCNIQSNDQVGRALCEAYTIMEPSDRVTGTNFTGLQHCLQNCSGKNMTSPTDILKNIETIVRKESETYVNPSPSPPAVTQGTNAVLLLSNILATLILLFLI